MKNLIGNYTFKSPYHKRKQLRFNVIGLSYNAEFPLRVETVEYKGKMAIPVKANYPEKAIRQMIESGKLKRSAEL